MTQNKSWLMNKSISKKPHWSILLFSGGGSLAFIWQYGSIILNVKATIIFRTQKQDSDRSLMVIQKYIKKAQYTTVELSSFIKRQIFDYKKNIFLFVNVLVGRGVWPLLPFFWKLRIPKTFFRTTPLPTTTVIVVLMRRIWTQWFFF